MSIRWSSPEALEDRKFSEQSDVWSFGVLLYEIWSLGVLPYNGLTAPKVWAGVLKGLRLKQHTLCPNEIYLVMQACWDNYGERPKFSELLEMLSRCSGDSDDIISATEPEIKESVSYAQRPSINQFLPDAEPPVTISPRKSPRSQKKRPHSHRSLATGAETEV